MTAAAAKSERLSREDAARWHMGTVKNPMVIGALLLFDQRLTLDDLDAMVRETMIPQRRFRQHVVESTHPFGRPCWRDDAAFTVRAHVDQLNPSQAVDAAALVRLAGERMNVPLPAARSPWRLELVDLAPAGSALLVRIHHCIADGRALVALLHALSGGPLGRGDAATHHQPPSSPSPPPSFGLVRQTGFLAMLASRFRFLALSRDPVGLLRRPLSGEKRVAWSDAIPLDTVKAIARATGHRFIDVLLAGVAGALARYQRDHGQAPRSLRALLPVAVPIAASASRLGNHFASVFVRLPVATFDPMTRVELIARDMLALRGGGALRLAIGLVRLAGSIAPALERWAVRRGARRGQLGGQQLGRTDCPVARGGQGADIHHRVGARGGQHRAQPDLLRLRRSFASGGDRRRRGDRPAARTDNGISGSPGRPSSWRSSRQPLSCTKWARRSVCLRRSLTGGDSC